MKLSDLLNFVKCKLFVLALGLFERLVGALLKKLETLLDGAEEWKARLRTSPALSFYERLKDRN